MNKLFINLFALISVLSLLSCTGEIDGFSGQDSSATNIIDAANFSLGLSEVNPEVITVDTTVTPNTTVYHAGVTVQVTARAGDRNNLLITSGTVHFRTEWGYLSETSCELTSSGSCSITWTSFVDGPYLSTNQYNSITAYTYGEESFVDLNGNDALDDGETYTDIDEPYIDRDDDDTFSAGDNPIDLDSSGTHTVADGKYNGTSCLHSTDCSRTTQVAIYKITTMDLLVTK